MTPQSSSLTLLAIMTLGSVQLNAAFTFETISNATEGSMASRVVLGAERTLVAYRAGDDLVAATSTGGQLVHETILAHAHPSKIYASIGTRGAELITYWNGNFFRFATKVTPGSGNCGPTSNWRCAGIALPFGLTSTLEDNVVGQVDASLTAHFIYRLRTTLYGDFGTFYVTRTSAAVWSTPAQVNLAQLSGKSPVSMELVSAAQLGFLSVGNGGATVVAGNNGSFSSINGNLPVSTVTSGDMEKRTAPHHFCVSKGAAELRHVKRSPNTGQWLGDFTVLYGVEGARPHCSIQVRSAGDPVIAYTNTSDIVRLWRNGVWETVDASSTFSRPIIDLTPANKLLILYQGPGYLKFGREQ